MRCSPISNSSSQISTPANKLKPDWTPTRIDDGDVDDQEYARLFDAWLDLTYRERRP